MSMTPHDGWHAVPARTDRRRKLHTRPQPGTFGRLVRDYRMDMDISQSTLAERIGVNHSYISRIEGNTRTPEIGVVRDLAAALRLTPAETERLYEASGVLTDIREALALLPDELRERLVA